MDHITTRIADNLVERVTGPMKFRLLLQPAMATFFAIRRWIERRPRVQAGIFLGPLHRQGRTRGDVEERLEVGRKSVRPCDGTRCGLPAHRAPLDRLSGRSSAGRDHSGHRALPVDPRACQSHRLRKSQSSQGAIGRRLGLMVTNCLTAHTISGHDPPASTRSEPTRAAHGSITKGFTGQRRQPQRNKLNLKRNKPWLSNLTS